MEKHLEDNDFIISKTDLQGNITYGNDKFIEMSGYSEKELLGAPHNILRHPQMPKIVFQLLWERISAKKEIFAYVKNKAKDSSYYWVFTNVTASLNSSGKIVGYYSVRRKPNSDAVKAIEPIYKELLEIEKHSGVQESAKYLESLLNKNGVTYDQFIISLQQ